MRPAYVRQVVLPRRKAREGARVVAAAIALVCIAPYALGAAEDYHRRHYKYPKREYTETKMHELAYDAFPIWAVWHPGQSCPRSLDDLQVYLGGGSPRDGWMNGFYFSCGAHAIPRGAPGIWILSPGEDGTLGTADDLPLEAP